MATMTSSQFWDHMKERAAMHIAAVTEEGCRHLAHDRA